MIILYCCYVFLYVLILSSTCSSATLLCIDRAALSCVIVCSLFETIVLIHQFLYFKFNERKEGNLQINRLQIVLYINIYVRMLLRLQHPLFKYYNISIIYKVMNLFGVSTWITQTAFVDSFQVEIQYLANHLNSEPVVDGLDFGQTS